MTALRVGFVGLTHLGIVSSAAAAARGADIVGVDDDASVVAAMVAQQPAVFEDGLAGLLATHADRLRYTTDRDDLSQCDVVYVSVDVPTDDSGRSDLTPVHEATELARSSTTAPIVILSQVPPGFTRREAGGDPRVLYQVETLVFGDAVRRALDPERFIVGTADGARPPEVVERFLASFGCPVLPMRFESAELCKIAINVMLAAQVSATNTLAGVAEGIGADWAEIVPALRLDRRIGPHAYLGAGLGLAGGNIERDLDTVRVLADRVGSDSDLIRAIVHDSGFRRGWILRRLASTLRPDAVIAVLGLAYKPGTASMKNSSGAALADALASLDVRVHDPLVPWPGAASEPMAAVRGADAVVLATAWDDYRSLVPAAIADAMRGNVVIDPHRLLDGFACEAAGLRHHVLGRGTR